MMTDTISTEMRHELMSKIKSKDTKIELKVRLWLYHHGIRYRKNCRDIVGKPDIAIKKYKIAVFIHGCFWHGHENCNYYRMPKTNIEYWQEKIEKNKERDKKVIEKLKAEDWKVFVIWECMLKDNFNENMESLCKDIKDIMNIQNCIHSH